MLWLLFVLWLAGIALFVMLFLRKRREILTLMDRSRCLERSDPLLRSAWEIDANVWLCSGLPTSFVYRTPMTWGKVGTARTTYQIFLQEELSPQRQKLVLLHELRHIKLVHCWWKGLAAFTLVLNWWNPVAWPLYFLLCRDLELACDRSVMKRLDRDEQREYARTLVELGAGKQIWDAPLAFGECDGALRVKAIANWTPKRWWVYIPATLLALVLAQFLWMGGHYKLPPPQDMPLAWERETGSADNFALDLGREMGQKIHHARDELAPGDPRVLDVREVWEGPEESPWQILWVLDGEGNWYRTESAWWGMSSGWAGVRSAEPMDAPDLSDSTLIYRR